VFIVISAALYHHHSLISGFCPLKHVDINLQSGQFWATSIVSFRDTGTGSLI